MKEQELRALQKGYRHLCRRLETVHRNAIKQLAAHYDIVPGDVVEYETKWSPRTRRMVVTELDLVRPYRHWSADDMLDEPHLLVDGIIVTQKRRLHARRSTLSFNTSVSFQRIGRFELEGKGRLTQPVGQMLEPRQ